MNKTKILKKVNLNQAGLNSIKDKVAEVEKNTNGEIALALIYQSDSYSFIELVIAFGLALISYVLMMIFAPNIWHLIEQKLWYPSPTILPMLMGLTSLIIVTLFFLLLNIPAINRLIIPKQIKHNRTYARAVRHFVECGINDTKERTGILIFVSLLERKVFVLSDIGIAKKVNQNQWQEVCNIITRNIKENKTTKAFTDAVDYCGKILKEHFPKKAGNPNEHPDGLVVLDF